MKNWICNCTQTMLNQRVPDCDLYINNSSWLLHSKETFHHLLFFALSKYRHTLAVIGYQSLGHHSTRWYCHACKVKRSIQKNKWSAKINMHTWSWLVIEDDSCNVIIQLVLICCNLCLVAHLKDEKYWKAVFVIMKWCF